MLPESYALPLMSKRLRLIIENNLTGKEKIEWITANVIGGNVTQKYYVAKFRCKLDVLDHKETVFGENAAHIVIPCFSSKKIMAYAVFHKPGWFWKIPTALYVCERLKKIITKERLTGVAFEEAYVK